MHALGLEALRSGPLGQVGWSGESWTPSRLTLTRWLAFVRRSSWATILSTPATFTILATTAPGAATLALRSKLLRNGFKIRVVRQKREYVRALTAVLRLHYRQHSDAIEIEIGFHFPHRTMCCISRKQTGSDGALRSLRSRCTPCPSPVGEEAG
jgi:hypothetical protein